VVVRFGHGDGLGRDGLLGEKSDLEHDPEKWVPVFQKDHHQITSQGEIPSQSFRFSPHLFHARFSKEQSAGSLR
jgi:hypothetical protein